MFIETPNLSLLPHHPGHLFDKNFICKYILGYPANYWGEMLGTSAWLFSLWDLRLVMVVIYELQVKLSF